LDAEKGTFSKMKGFGDARIDPGSTENCSDDLHYRTAHSYNLGKKGLPKENEESLGR